MSGRDISRGGTHLFVIPTGRRIDRVWVWLHRVPLRSSQADLDALVSSCADLEVSDVVISLNSWNGGGAEGVTQLPPFISGSADYQGLSSLCQQFGALQPPIDFHFMIFVTPVPEFIERSADIAKRLARTFHPRSVLLDAEHWWTHDTPGVSNRGAALRAVREHFTETWPREGHGSPLGVGATGTDIPPRSFLDLLN